MPTTVAPRPPAGPDFSRTRPARIALVGERSAGVPALTRYAPMLEALWRRERLLVDAYWLSTAQLDGPRDLAGFDGIWLVPGSPYRGEAAAVSAVRTARERDIPLPATCGGFLHVLLGFARHVCAPDGAAHAENSSGSPLPLSRGLAGHEGTVHTEPGSPAEEALGARTTVERYQCTSALRPAVRRRPARPRVAPHRPRRRPPPHRRTAGTPVLPVHLVPARTGRRHLPAPPPGARFRLGGGRTQHGDVIERHSSAPVKRMTRSA
ncbi:hypothetical protein AB0407_34740 [Streptomyces microflavus]|uniref:hypothetical protein n=1 Tax=Streptomyces microflavus TaxID=1919 RepID=UPI003450E354